MVAHAAAAAKQRADVFYQAYAPCAHPQVWRSTRLIGSNRAPLRTNPVSFAREVVHQANIAAWRVPRRFMSS